MLIRVSDISRRKVLVQKKQSKKDAEAGRVTYSKLGKIHNVVFSPDGRRVVGVLVSRPDIAGMVKRDDVFVALDAIEPRDKSVIMTGGENDVDDAAIKRLGVDWDACLIWEGMDAKTTNGRELGFIADAEFDSETGDVRIFLVGDGSMAKAIVGQLEIPVDMLVGYRDGWMIVDADASKLELNGGVAAKAGEGVARIRYEGGRAVAKADEAAGKAIDEGSHKLGKALGKAKRAVGDATAETRAKVREQAPSPEEAARSVGRHLGKVGGMFSSFKDEFDKASKSDR